MIEIYFLLRIVNMRVVWKYLIFILNQNILSMLEIHHERGYDDK